MDKIQQAAFGGGCFWGIQHYFDHTPGVISTESGYMGGQKVDPTYREVCTGKTGHVEVVLVTYDSEKISFDALCDLFWRMHDPTQKDRQGVDIGTQYRSVIYCWNEEQKKIAENSKRNFEAKGVFLNPVVTEIKIETKFFAGEQYHQKYFAKNGGPVCHVLRER